MDTHWAMALSEKEIGKLIVAMPEGEAAGDGNISDGPLKSPSRFIGSDRQDPYTTRLHHQEFEDAHWPVYSETFTDIAVASRSSSQFPPDTIPIIQDDQDLPGYVERIKSRRKKSLVPPNNSVDDLSLFNGLTIDNDPQIHSDVISAEIHDDEFMSTVQVPGTEYSNPRGSTNPLIEQNWSGRGQHADFQKDERKLPSEILDVQETLGKTSSAIVESVKCRRILLARKTMFCNRHFTKE
ncbi:hypothetical protein EJ02DRAFT_513476 [Clathrospora elynae]|uniref:Uncharacterized protein n=1 Tax=Clathrospora elynae TaxID=706981 RepID=A0A6A5SH72_9PLEO|nr:hypothetical protein EJ02DRAFT_513476 [Clathrospora elynae]